MKRIAVLVAIIGFLAFARSGYAANQASEAGDKQKAISEADDRRELAKLDGTWILVNVEIDGKSLLKKGATEQKLVIKGGKVTSEAKEAPKDGVELSKILDPSKKPKTVTMPFEGRIKFYGIYEVDGDEFRICGVGFDAVTEKNPEGRRPKEFDSKKGLLLVFKRLPPQKDDRSSH